MRRLERCCKVNISHFSYPEPAKGKTDVLADVSFEIREHDFIGLIGASGSGKTTLIKHLNGLLKAESGEILLKGKIYTVKKYPVSELRKKSDLYFNILNNSCLAGRFERCDVWSAESGNE